MKWVKNFLLPLILLTSSALGSDSTPPTAEKSTRFVVISDMPYTNTEYALLEHPDGAIAKAIKALNPPLMIHLGDFKKGWLSCSDELFKDHYRQIAYLNPHKTVYTPGDNDWTDCDRFTLSARHDELERLKYLQSQGLRPNRYFWRTLQQVEIDYIEEGDGQLAAYEFKWQRKSQKMPLAFANAYPGSTFEVVDRDNFEGFVGGL